MGIVEEVDDDNLLLNRTGWDRLVFSMLQSRDTGMVSGLNWIHQIA